MTEEHLFFKNKSGEKIAGVLHVPKKKTDRCVIFCHGFMGSKTHWKSECTRFAERGFAALRFDFSGVGESEGKFEEMGYAKQVGDLVNAIDVVEKKGYKKIGVVGHSFAGGVVVLASAQDPRIKSVVATAPTVFPSAEKLAEYASSAGKKMSKKFFDDVKKVDVIAAAKKRSCPLLIITGTEDDVIPVEQSKELFAKAKELRELKLIEGADHNFTGHDEELVDAAWAWMKKTL